MNFLAFISYSRADQRLIGRLHRRLEAFRVPRDLAGSPGKYGLIPSSLRPIFLDRADLPAGVGLTDSLREAIKNSRFLIVVCTPNSSDSNWVKLEVNEFLKTHPISNALPVLWHEGKYLSDETMLFPEPLRHLDLLAADMREIQLPSGQVVGDGFDGAVLKIAAGLLGVPLDRLVLRQRARERKFLLLSIIAALVMTGAAVAGTIFGLFGISAQSELTELRDRVAGRRFSEAQLHDVSQALRDADLKHVSIGWIVGDAEGEDFAKQFRDAANSAGLEVSRFQPSAFFYVQPERGVTVRAKLGKAEKLVLLLLKFGFKVRAEGMVDDPDYDFEIFVSARPQLSYR